MAYVIPWDEASPDGAITPAADIDVELQDLKTSVAERLEQVIPGWRDDLVDPKVIPSAAIDNSSAFAWSIFFASGTVLVPSTGAQLQLSLTQGLNVPGENPWSTSGGNAVLPDDGSYVVIGNPTLKCYAPGAIGLVGTKLLGLPSGPAQHNDAMVASYIWPSASAAESPSVTVTGTSISMIKEAGAGDMVQAYATSQDLSPLSGRVEFQGMTLFILRLGA